MQEFWAFINRKPVRLVLAVICAVMLMQGIYGIQVAQTRLGMFRCAGDIVLWGSWTLVNIMRAYGREISKPLNIAVNVGLAMVIISIFLNWKG